jgi:hypothetical protein
MTGNFIWRLVFSRLSFGFGFGFGLRCQGFSGDYQPFTGIAEWESGAGEGNRTLVTCLGSKSSTIELRPHALGTAMFAPQQ